MSIGPGPYTLSMMVALGATPGLASAAAVDAPIATSRHGATAIAATAVSPEGVARQAPPLLPGAVVAQAATAVPATPTRKNINPYDRDIELTVPLNFNRRVLGEMPVVLTRDDRFIVQSAGFLALIDPLLTEQAQAELAAALAGHDTFAPELIEPTGIRLDYDPQQLSVLVLRIDPTKRTVEPLFQGGRSEKPDQAPLPFSAYLNSNLTVQRLNSTGDVTKPSVFLNGAMRYENLVFEGDFQGREDQFTGAYKVDRRYARLVYDQADDYRRWYLGDLDPELRGRQGFVQLGGLGVSRQTQRFDTFRTGVISGDRRLTLQEASTLRVTRNGVLVREFRLDPGQYNLSNLPLDTGSNDINVEIRNDAGRVQNVRYSAYLDSIELEPGDYEYAAYLGATSNSLFGSPSYDRGKVAFTGYYRKAFENRPALGVGLQASGDVQVLTAQSQLILRNGSRVRVDLAGSTGDVGTGYASAVGFDHVVEHGDQTDAWTVTADYTSARFSSLGNVSGDNVISWVLSANYSRTFNPRLYASLSGSYNVSRSPLSGDSYNVSASSGYRFHRDWSVQAGVEYLRYGGVPGAVSTERRDGFGFNIALIWQPRYDRRAEARYRSATNSAQISFSQTPEDRANSFGYSALANYDDGPAQLSGQLDYIGNRFDATLSHAALGSNLRSVTDEQITTLRFGSTIATTGRKWAIGRNIYDSFAIVYPHKSLDGRQVITGDTFEGGRYRSKSGLFGPALANALGSYVNQSVRYDVLDPPQGYDVGDGVTRVHPTYRSGYNIEVGSADFVSAFGTLVDETGGALKLISGRIVEVGKADAASTVFFTNSAGRFAAQNLEPGKRYRVELFTSPPVSFEFSVPKDNTGLLRLNTVKVPAPPQRQ
jgi:outer membrane usher protein